MAEQDIYKLVEEINKNKVSNNTKIDSIYGLLDEVKKENENPSVGVILCASKDDEVVEYALSRSLSPTMVSEYTLKLIDKKLLQEKLKEYVELTESTEDAK